MICKKILSKHAIKTYLTRSADGMSLINETEMKQFSTKAVEVFDVSGAGDTVVAALAFGLGNGWTPAESIGLPILPRNCYPKWVQQQRH